MTYPQVPATVVRSYASQAVPSVAATGLPGDDEREGARIDSALDSWGADAPAWPEVED